MKTNCPICAEALNINTDENHITECPYCGGGLSVEITISPAQKQAHYTDEVWLRRGYEENRRSMANIAEQCAVSPMTINRWLNVHGIPTRRRGQTGL